MKSYVFDVLKFFASLTLKTILKEKKYKSNTTNCVFCIPAKNREK